MSNKNNQTILCFQILKLCSSYIWYDNLVNDKSDYKILKKWIAGDVNQYLKNDDLGRLISWFVISSDQTVMNFFD